MLQCDIITLCYKNAFCLEKQVLRLSERQYLLMFPMGYSVKLSLFPFRAGEDDIYGYTTGTGNIGFWMPTFAGGIVILSYATSMSYISGFWTTVPNPQI